jgi:AbrB family looped-hinge helix DNA binding protein
MNFLQQQTLLMATRKTPVSRVTKKYQATIPQAVREVLGISQGDCVAFEIVQGQVVLKKVQFLDWDYLEAVAGTLNEWASEADESAYRDL